MLRNSIILVGEGMIYNFTVIDVVILRVTAQGTLFRGNEKEEIRKNMIKEDVIEGVIALPPKLFYGSGIPNAKVYVASEMESLEHQIVFL